MHLFPEKGSDVNTAFFASFRSVQTYTCVLRRTEASTRGTAAAWRPFFALLVLSIETSSTFAAEDNRIAIRKANEIANDVSEMDLFDAIEREQIAVQFIPHDATKANVLIQNLRDIPVSIRLPEVFAAAPIVAQGFGGGGGGQGVGGGFGGGGRGGGAGDSGGLFRTKPGKQRKVSVETACLEHGRPAPSPKMTYQILPLDEFTKDDRIAGLCKWLGPGLISKSAAQAVAWHLAMP